MHACTHTHGYAQSNSLWDTRPTEQCVLISPIILIVNTVTWYVQKKSHTVSLSNQHLIIFNVCVWRTTKVWIIVAGLPAHLQLHRVRQWEFGWNWLLTSRLYFHSWWSAAHICPLPEIGTCNMKRKKDSAFQMYTDVCHGCKKMQC